jgi:riboflavin kinase/FMN adenylyltransferase
MLQRLAEKARELKVACSVLTFEPHPREFFAPAAAPSRLSRLREKLELIAAAGIDRTHVLRFGASLAALPAERFIDEMLVRALGVRWLLVGRDFRFGAKRAGDFALLEAAAGKSGFGLEAMADVRVEGERVSSSRVRAALAEADLAAAEQLLGRPYMMSGRVAHGEKLGRTLGCPTANIILRRKPALAGIFAVEVELEETQASRQGVASVGRRPTVQKDAAPLLEVHLFDWQGDLYGRHLRVAFRHKLRDERTYDSMDALREAIAQDMRQARAWFKNNG